MCQFLLYRTLHWELGYIKIFDSIMILLYLCDFIVGPQPDWDPDIVATLDDDYEHCNCLDDDFVGVANGPPSDSNHDDTLDLQNE